MGRTLGLGAPDFTLMDLFRYQPPDERGLSTQEPAALFANIANSFGVSTEARTLYRFLADPFDASDAEIGTFLVAVYGNLFDRTPDEAGLVYWTGEIRQSLAAGEFGGSILVDILSGTRNTPASPDLDTLIGKLIVGLHYVHQQQAHGTAWCAADIVETTEPWKASPAARKA